MKFDLPVVAIAVFQVLGNESELSDVLLELLSSSIGPESGVSHFSLTATWFEDFHRNFGSKLLLDEGLGGSIDIERKGSAGVAVDRLQALMIAEPDFSSAANVTSIGLIRREEGSSHIDSVGGCAVAKDNVECLDRILLEVDNVAIEVGIDVVGQV